MTIKQVPAKYQASDGKEFDNEEEAQLHDELITAREEYNAARGKFSRAVAATQKTADGELFDFKSGDFWFVTDYYNQEPRLKRVHFLGWNFEITEYSDRVEISQDETDGNNRQQRHSYPINKLYTTKRRASEALIGALEVYAVEVRRTVNETQAEVRRRHD
jgi:hypothetical protein